MSEYIVFFNYIHEEGGVKERAAAARSNVETTVLLLLKRVVLEWISEKQDSKMWLSLTCIRIRTNGGLL